MQERDFSETSIFVSNKVVRLHDGRGGSRRVPRDFHIEQSVKKILVDIAGNLILVCKYNNNIKIYDKIGLCPTKFRCKFKGKCLQKLNYAGVNFAV